ncbi:MAG: hypothetical protein KIT84_37695 [Labilithrix sp.]|nr:hypothetical protein [Labilithrix sp.]MCW5816792.1 hypothetical protein [Labilithrix sp.]
MRLTAFAAAVLVTACGGKTTSTDGDGSGGAATAATADPATPGCPKPVPWTRDYGDVDVSSFGCECADRSDCAAGEICMTFPSLSSAHCVRTSDACSVVDCRGSGTCIVAASEPVMPLCYH